MACDGQPGRCPICGLRVPEPGVIVGTWTGTKADGRPGGGSLLEARCRRCRVPLVAHVDVYDDRGAVRPEGRSAAPRWRVRGFPWQSVLILIAAVGLAAAAWRLWRG